VGFFLEIWTEAGLEPIPLDGVRFTVGRSDGNDVRLIDEKASRSHAVLELVGKSWCIRDLSSSNGTFVNGARITTERPLEPNDEIRVGDTRILYRSTSSTTEHRTVASTGLSLPTLTPRERDVLEALCAPLLSNAPYPEPATTKEIAGTLVVSEAAVRQHLLRLYDKFGIPDNEDRRRSQLAREAINAGAVTRT
jgi:predicted component of type VI protein secretion system